MYLRQRRRTAIGARIFTVLSCIEYQPPVECFAGLGASAWEKDSVSGSAHHMQVFGVLRVGTAAFGTGWVAGRQRLKTLLHRSRDRLVDTCGSPHKSRHHEFHDESRPISADRKSSRRWLTRRSCTLTRQGGGSGNGFQCSCNDRRASTSACSVTGHYQTRYERQCQGIRRHMAKGYRQRYVMNQRCQQR